MMNARARASVSASASTARACTSTSISTTTSIRFNVLELLAASYFELSSNRTWRSIIYASLNIAYMLDI